MTLPTSPALTYSIGHVDHPPTYYEVLTPAAGSAKPPVVMIHGGAHTGACYLATPDGRLGWAHVFAAQGYRVVVPDWPGLGRSGYIPLSEISGASFLLRAAGIVERIGSVKEMKGSKPSNLFSVTNPLIGKYIFKELSASEFVRQKLRVCDGCGALLIRDWETASEATCQYCDKSWILTRAKAAVAPTS